MQRLRSAVVSSASRVFTTTGFSTSLGTDTLSADLVNELQSELAAEERKKRDGVSTFAEALRNSVGKAELDHMESPEADAAHLQRVDRMMEDLFARLPTPKDPMRAALAPTKEEVAESERLEVFKESVRERYLASQSRKRREEERIAKAMRTVENGTHPAFQRASEYSSSVASSGGAAELEPSSDEAGDDSDDRALARELEDMRRRVAALEAKIRRRTQK